MRTRKIGVHKVLGASVPGIVGLLAIVIAMITISFQSVKAALVNPVKSLKQQD